jgi:hypothetical protein
VFLNVTPDMVIGHMARVPELTVPTMLNFSRHFPAESEYATPTALIVDHPETEDVTVKSV